MFSETTLWCPAWSKTTCSEPNTNGSIFDGWHRSQQVSRTPSTAESCYWQGDWALLGGLITTITDWQSSFACGNDQRWIQDTLSRAENTSALPCSRGKQTKSKPPSATFWIRQHPSAWPWTCGVTGGVHSPFHHRWPPEVSDARLPSFQRETHCRQH